MRKWLLPISTSGCVNGVMRNFLISALGEEIEEREIELTELHEADELIFTNAIRGVQWVKTFESRNYKK